MEDSYMTSEIRKTILVDAINTFVIKDEGIFEDMHKMLNTWPNRKIILTGANDEQMVQFGLDKMPYEIFTLKHDPEKTDPSYYKTMLKHFNLKPEDVVYFEHSEEAVKSARSVGINSYYYDKDAKDLTALKKFIDDNL
jgi:HAD superfamily hydrolase (TIGR01509 family)